MKKAIKRISGLLAGCVAFLIPLQAFAAEEEQTMKEKMGFAVQNTVIGIVTVFVMLVVIALVIYCFRFLPKLLGRFSGNKGQEGSENKTAKVSPPPSGQDAAAPPGADSAELVAVITAAVAAARAEETQSPAGSFVVRTIKRRA